MPALSAYLKERGVKGVVVRPDRYPLGAEIKRGKDMKEIFWKNHTTGNLYPIRWWEKEEEINAVIRRVGHLISMLLQSLPSLSVSHLKVRESRTYQVKCPRVQVAAFSTFVDKTPAEDWQKNRQSWGEKVRLKKLPEIAVDNWLKCSWYSLKLTKLNYSLDYLTNHSLEIIQTAYLTTLKITLASGRWNHSRGARASAFPS